MNDYTRSQMNVAYPVLGSLTDSRKGSMGNRIECAGEHTGNQFKTGLKQAGVAAAVAGVAVTAAKNEKIGANLKQVDGFISSQAKKAGDALLKNASGSQLKYLDKAKELWKACPKFVKVLGALIMAGTVTKSAYESGRIEQKYEDRAKAQILHG